MTKASDNIFPKVTFVEGAAPASPAASDFSLYFDSADHLLKWKNSAGAVTTVATGTSSGVATDAIWDAAGDLAVGTGADTAARLAKGNAGGTLAMGNSAVIWNAGTSFPASKATNDRYWRTDLGMEFFWDGTQWVSSVLHHITLVNTFGVTTSPQNFYAPSDHTYDMFVTTADFDTFAGSLSGSAYWTVTLNKVDSANSATSLGSFNQSADSSNVWTRHQIVVNAAVTNSGYRVFTVVLAKTSTPGGIYAPGLIHYRIIAT